MPLTNNYVRPENTYAARQRQAKIASARSTAAAERERAKPRDDAPSIGDVWAASLEKERRQEVAAQRARIQRAVARYSEVNLAAMRAEPKPKAVPKSKGYRRKV